MTGHSQWRTVYSHSRVNEIIVVGKMALGNVFVRVLLFILFNQSFSI